VTRITITETPLNLISHQALNLSDSQTVHRVLFLPRLKGEKRGNSQNLEYGRRTFKKNIIISGLLF
jgi:hypothetical protein